MIKKKKFIPEYPEFNYQEDGRYYKIGINSNLFTFSFQISKHVNSVCETLRPTYLLTQI